MIRLSFVLMLADLLTFFVLYIAILDRYHSRVIYCLICPVIIIFLALFNICVTSRIFFFYFAFLILKKLMLVLECILYLRKVLN